jgi:hypothetical protein
MYTPLGTLYWRALHRVERRAAAHVHPDLLREAVRTCNAIARLYMGGFR